MIENLENACNALLQWHVADAIKKKAYSLVHNRRTGSFVKTAAYFGYRLVCCGKVRLVKKKKKFAGRPQQAEPGVFGQNIE